ncbi:allophanate hydrolase [Nocardia flavorosea]|uniref:allophanate hydrolase n=1 Tax=Nocardia flavorosea TaxID=53429 RepID=UPI001E609180|nr:allophanate hydrolase [Nocardia flavorosea]
MTMAKLPLSDSGTGSPTESGTARGATGTTAAAPDTTATAHGKPGARPDTTGTASGTTATVSGGAGHAAAAGNTGGAAYSARATRTITETAGNAPAVVDRVAAAYRIIAEQDRPEVWISLRAEADVLAEAAALDARVEQGDELPLAGVLVAVKDNIDIAGIPTTCACPGFAHTPEHTAPAVARLTEHGAIVLGKTNLDQFATGLVGTRSPYGAVRNSRFPDRVAGGSSSGSAVAVALGMVDAALGTDTAGSGRVPAALNGIVGIKPTLGLIPATGLVPACPDYDAISVFARDLALATKVANIMIGPDPADPRSRAWPADTPLGAPARTTLAVPTDDNLQSLTTAYRAAFDATVARWRADGGEIATVDIAELLDAAKLLYDGAIVAQRYTAVGEFLSGAPEGADPLVSAIITGGARPAAHSYVADLDRLTHAAATARRLFTEYPALLVPTTTEHPTLEAVAAEPLSINSRMGTFTNFCNLLDLAAVAVPGENTAGGDPFGVMFVTPAFADQIGIDLAARLLGEPSPLLTGTGTDLLVVGAHLRGLPLHHQLEQARARFLGEVRTAAAYRMVALPAAPPKPGMLRVGSGGHALPGELYRLSPAALGTFLSNLPSPMTLGKVELDSGEWVTGFACDFESSRDATDITEYGGWRNYLNADR